MQEPLKSRSITEPLENLKLFFGGEAGEIFGFFKGIFKPF
jgi:hypothetical protein